MTDKNKKTIEKNGDRLWFALGTASVAIMIIGTIVSLILFSVRANRAFEMLNGQDVKIRDSYYVMVTGDEDSAFWKEVYARAKNICEEDSIEFETISNHLEGNYSVAELVDLAAMSGVDGIIVKADESTAMREAIDRATSQGIPVVTVVEDSSVSSRKSFIQVGSYNIGREYGRRILESLEDGKCSIQVVMEAGARDGSQNLIIAGLQETLDAAINSKSVQFSAIAIDSTDTFAAEESIRKLLMPETDTPDVLITLNELTTTSAYQAMIDFNRVGTITLLGYGASDTILKGIRQGVIDSTIAINVDEIGSYCIEALNEYRQTGYVSEYYSVDTQLITKEILDDEKPEEVWLVPLIQSDNDGGETYETP